MTVLELIKILESKNPSSRVVVSGYEDGLSDIGNVRDIALKINVNSEDYYGPHEEVDSGEDEKAIYIARANNQSGD